MVILLCFIFAFSIIHMIIKGDARIEIKKIPDNSIDLVLTDPPYGVSRTREYADEGWDVEYFSREFYRVLKNDTRVYIFAPQKTAWQVIAKMEKGGFKFVQALVWVRKNIVRGVKSFTYWDFTSTYEFILLFHKGKPKHVKVVPPYVNADVLYYPKPQSNFSIDKGYHPHQKPLELIKHLIAVSSERGDVVFDPFGGAGTTAVAAMILGRKFIIIEREEKYIKITEKRLEETKRKYPWLF